MWSKNELKIEKQHWRAIRRRLFTVIIASSKWPTSYVMCILRTKKNTKVMKYSARICAFAHFSVGSMQLWLPCNAHDSLGNTTRSWPHSWAHDRLWLYRYSYNALSSIAAMQLKPTARETKLFLNLFHNFHDIYFWYSFPSIVTYV